MKNKHQGLIIMVFAITIFVLGVTHVNALEDETLAIRISNAEQHATQLKGLGECYFLVRVTSHTDRTAVIYVAPKPFVPEENYTHSYYLAGNNSTVEIGTSGNQDEWLWAVPQSGSGYYNFDITFVQQRHQYNVTENVLPTCEKDGYKKYTCKKCGFIKKEIVKATGHSYGTLSSREPTCTEPGLEDHYYCSACNTYFDSQKKKISIEDITISMIPHVYVQNNTEEKYLKTAATCVDSAVYYKSCICGEKTTETFIAGEPLDHDYQVVEGTAIAATCTTDGREADKKCSRCESNIKGAVIKALGHQWDDGIANIPDTCDENRIKTFTCKVAGCGAQRTETIGPLGHDYSTDWTTNDNYHWHTCKHNNCKETDSYGEHDWIERITKQPSCTERGEKTIACSVCGKEIKEDISKASHTWNKTYTIDKDATCAEEGEESIHCANCNAIKEGSSRSIQKTGHTFSAWRTTTAPSELAGGQRSRSCTVCGHTERSSIGALAPTLPSVKISKPKAAKKAATVKWKKVSKKNLKKIKKVQIQYSLDGSFRSGVKTTTASAKKTSKKIKIPKGQKYYVRVRALTGNHVSKWSSVKSVKAK